MNRKIPYKLLLLLFLSIASNIALSEIINLECSISGRDVNAFSDNAIPSSVLNVKITKGKKYSIETSSYTGVNYSFIESVSEKYVGSNLSDSNKYFMTYEWKEIDSSTKVLIQINKQTGTISLQHFYQMYSLGDKGRALKEYSGICSLNNQKNKF
jgi:hypothetical protein